MRQTLTIQTVSGYRETFRGNRRHLALSWVNCRGFWGGLIRRVELNGRIVRTYTSNAN